MYKEDLQAVLPAGLSKDDSLLFAEHYVRSWVEDVLLFNQAQSNIPDNGEIDKLVEKLPESIDHAYLSARTNQPEIVGRDPRTRNSRLLRKEQRTV
mgnify:CR=1 FL=1